MKTNFEILSYINSISLDRFDEIDFSKNYFDFFNLNDILVEFQNNIYSNQHNFKVEFLPIEPDICDLARIHYLSLKKNSIQVLEFGSGFSTVVFAHSMMLKRIIINDSDVVKTITRSEKIFHVDSVDESEEYSKLLSFSMPKYLVDYVTYHVSKVCLIKHDSRICTIYDQIPNVIADLIYLDGPSVYATKDAINGISLDRDFRFPISADLLLLEFTLEPGAVIVIDGRTTNFRFLKSYFKRNWIHQEFKDVYLCELNENPLGSLNEKKLEFSGGMLLK